MVDVCLVVEGTYPRVVGGVSQWVDDLVRGLPGLSFGVVRLDYDGERSTPVAYSRPANLAELVELRLDPGEPLAVERAVRAAPSASIYHCLATGFAGLAGASIAAERGGPLLISEHGLYWHEARLGVPTGCSKHRTLGPHPFARRSGDGARGRLARWQQRGRTAGEPACSPAHRQAVEQWAALQRALAQRAYAQADAIVSVCRANSVRQRSLGADPTRLHVIENGVQPDTLAGARTGGGPLIGMVARVSPIKDVATFLHACRMIAGELPDARFVIVGPCDEEPEYAARCVQLAADLGLGERVVFTGETDPARWYPQLDVAVLTSISEGQPLALLEAMAAGVPVVATSVGGCSELLGGDGRRPTGLLTPARDPRATAAAVLGISCDAELRASLAGNGRRRVRERHSIGRTIGSYRRLYERVAV